MGMNRETGRSMSEAEHLRQSIMDILSTAKGDRCCNRAYGCGLFELVDQPLTTLLLTKIYSEITDSINKFEPRVYIKRVKAERAEKPYHLTIDLELELKSRKGESIFISGVKV